jgi:hypothetical protein
LVLDWPIGLSPPPQPAASKQSAALAATAIFMPLIVSAP